MKRGLLVAATAALLALCVTGGGAAQVQIGSEVAQIVIPPDLPPSPATWPKYPHFPKHSCWGRPFGKDTLLTRVAPSYAPSPRAHPLSPYTVAQRLLAHLGDTRYVRSITFSPASRVDRRHFGAPSDALQAAAVVASAYRPGTPVHGARTIVAKGIAEFESEIVLAALRDDLCDAGGPPLVWDSWWALDQRFPNPAPEAFRKRVALVGTRFGFTVASLRLLRPRQIAPVLIVKTKLPRKRFVREIPRILELLNPTSRSGRQTAVTFEAFFFAAEDARGPFTFTAGVSRSGASGSEWAANPDLYPFTHG